MATECSWNDGSKAQYYVVILDRLLGRSGGLERAPEWRVRGPLTVEPLEFHDVDPVTISHVNDNPDWVNAPIFVPTPVFQTSPPVADHNLIDPINNQLAKAL